MTRLTRLLAAMTSALLLTGGLVVHAEPRCVDDAEGVHAVIDAGFAELARIHRARVPGPTGEAMLVKRVGGLLESFVAFERFVDDVLGDAWDKAGERQQEWRETLADALRQRYVGKIGSPLGVRLEVVAIAHRCDEAQVVLHVHRAGRKKAREVELRFVAEAPPVVPNPSGANVQEIAEPSDAAAGKPDEAANPPARWRAFDVSVDGVSLLETWRGRFRKIFSDGGVAAVDAHLRSLRERYPRGM